LGNSARLESFQIIQRSGNQQIIDYDISPIAIGHTKTKNYIPASTWEYTPAQYLVSTNISVRMTMLSRSRSTDKRLADLAFITDMLSTASELEPEVIIYGVLLDVTAYDARISYGHPNESQPAIVGKNGHTIERTPHNYIFLDHRGKNASVIPGSDTIVAELERDGIKTEWARRHEI